MSTQDPPTGLLPVLRKLGPGMILAGSIVGSGELIATTLTGAAAGFSFLWIILIGCIIKVFTQVEIARYAISSGKTTLAGFLDLPGGRGIFMFWLVMFLVGFGQLGGIVGGVGQALAISLPVTETGRTYNQRMEAQALALVRAQESQADASAIAAIHQQIDTLKQDLKPRDPILWCIGIGLLTMVLLFLGTFHFIETFCVVLVASFTLITVGNTLALQSYDAWAITAAELRHGLAFGFPEGDAGQALDTALKTFGIIGVGAAEIVAYPYWCIEKGYGRWTGPNEPTEAWATRARGWMRILRIDAWGSMILYTISTIAFYLLGAAILHRIGLVPAKSEMIRTLGLMYEPVFGPAGKTIFLFGAFAVLFSTFFVANAQKTRLLTDAVPLLLGKTITETQRIRSIRWLGLAFPAACVIIYLLYPNPTKLVLFSGLMQSLFLLPLGFAALYYRYRKTDPRLRPGRIWDVMLWISFACFVTIGLYFAWLKLAPLVLPPAS